MMRTISLRTIAAHKLRLVLSIFAVVLGTAFIAGSAFFTNVLSTTYERAAASQFEDVDLIATGPVSGAGMLSAFTGMSVNTTTISTATLAELREQPEVEKITVAVSEATVIIAGSDGKSIQGGSVGTAYVEGSPALGSTTLKEGSWPTDNGSIALDETTARNGGLSIGSTTTMVTSQGRSTVTITGIFDAPAAVSNSVLVIMPEDYYISTFSPSGVDTVMIKLTPGTSEEAGLRALSSAFPNLYFTKTSDIVQQTSELMGQVLKYIRYVLWTFAGIGLLVGTFIISNTFTMIVAQRNREFALLRSIGISSSQVTRSVLFEALIVGLIGSVIGILAGFGLARLIFAILAARGNEINGGTGIDAMSILVPLIFGIAITAISAWAPARAAGRVRPVEAMNALETKGILVRSCFGFPVLGLGILLLLLGTFSSSSVSLRVTELAVGAVFIVIGYWLAGPALSIPITAAIGRIIGAPFKTIGKLATTNSRRNPRRTAATAFALTLGIMLVTSVGMIGNTLSKSLTDELRSSINADFFISSADSNFTLPQDVPESIASVNGVKDIITIGTAPVVINGGTTTNASATSVVDGDLSEAYNNITLDAGSTAGDGVILNAQYAAARGITVGSLVNVSSQTETISVPVIGILSTDSSLSLSSGLITRAVLNEFSVTPSFTPASIFVTTQPGANLVTVQRDLENAVADYLVVQVQSKNDMTSTVTQVFNTMLGVVYALLALSIIIAVLGIINTLALSVVERTREIGMLRAVGLQRSQVRKIIYLESIVIALFGSIMGAVIGLSFGWAVVHTAGDILDAYVPWGQLIGLIIISALVGIIAAVLPAIKAARTQPLEAINA